YGQRLGIAAATRSGHTRDVGKRRSETRLDCGVGVRLRHDTLAVILADGEFPLFARLHRFASIVVWFASVGGGAAVAGAACIAGWGVVLCRVSRIVGRGAVIARVGGVARLSRVGGVVCSARLSRVGGIVARGAARTGIDCVPGGV